jgi:hypothetical protein
LRQIGADGVAVLATAAPCKPPIAALRAATLAAPAPTALAPTAAKPSTPVAAQSTGPSPAAACAESDVAPVVLCATIPAAAQLGNVELYVRQSDAAGHWSDSRMMPGEALANARFAAKPVESVDGPARKQVCIGFAQWSDQARIARMVVHYSL